MRAHGKHTGWQLRYQMQCGAPRADHHKLVLFLHVEHSKSTTEVSVAP